MAALLSLLRSGDFLTRERVRLWTIAVLVGFGTALIVMAATSHGLNDYQGRPLGTDFSSFYSAGRITLLGGSPYDQAALHHMQQDLFGASTNFYAFSYPPIFLLILEPLARIPYLAALALWQGASLLFYLGAMGRLRKTFAPVRDNLYWILVIGFTATFVNLTHGQNGFLTCGLFALGFAFLDQRPWLAGLCFGLLICKPQLGLLIPVALGASDRWKSFAGGAATVAALMLLSIAVYGLDAWRDFFAATSFSREAILDRGAVGFEKMISMFAWARLWGLPAGVAYGVQLAIALAAAAATAWLWRSKASLRAKAAALCFATLLATPFALDYDLMILAPAIALLAFESDAEGWLPYQRTLLAALWLAPIATREVAGYARIPFGAFIIAAALIFLLSVEKENCRASHVLTSA